MRASSRTLHEISAPPMAPTDAPIDLQHLSQMTLGERSLEREVLALFDRQAMLLLRRMRCVEPAHAAPIAHTLKGSARGVGAWRVALAAEAVEFAGADDLPAAIDALSDAIDEASRVIAELLRSH